MNLSIDRAIGPPAPQPSPLSWPIVRPRWWEYVVIFSFLALVGWAFFQIQSMPDFQEGGPLTQKGIAEWILAKFILHIVPYPIFTWLAFLPFRVFLGYFR